MEPDDRARATGEQHAPGVEPTRDGAVAEWLAGTTGRRIVVESDPAPTWAAHNVVVTVDDPRVARHIIRDWERIDKADHEASDRRVALMILAPPGSDVDDAGDDRAIARHALGRGLSGFVPGMLIGAVIVGLAAWLVVGSLTAALAGAGGGVAFGGPIGAVYAFVAASGWSSAYRESFVSRQPGARYAVTFHTGSPRSAEFAQLRAAEHTPADVDVIET
jgi:hypothetical protein